MRNYLILSTAFFLFLGCAINEKPEFLGVDNIKLIDASSQLIVLSANANFKNPNNIGGKLLTEGIKVYINDIETAHLVSEEFEVPAKDLFTIPLTVQVPTDSIFNDKSIVGLLGSLLNKNINVHYQGDIKYKVMGFSHKYKVDKKEDIKIKF